MKKLKIYVDELFQDAPKTVKVLELKEELMLDLEEKYNDLINEGKSEKDAYQEVISGIGNIEELLSGLNIEEIQADPVLIGNEQRKKTAFVVSVSVFLYILSLIVIAILSEIDAQVPDYAIVAAFFGISGFATCLLIYHFMSIPKQKNGVSASIKSHSDSNHKEIERAIALIIWTLTLILYFLISFLFRSWPISWILFIIAILVQEIVHLVFKIKEK